MSNEDQPQAEMPRYRSHKVVHALKLQSIMAPEPKSNKPTWILYFVDTGFKHIIVQATDPLAAHLKRARESHPEDTGYLVVYPREGYRSWSPTADFEDGYTLI